MPVTRAQAWETLQKYTKGEALLRHALAVEASTGAYAKHFGYGTRQGAAITSVVKGSPAGDAGLRAGHGSRAYLGVKFPVGADVIVAIGGSPVRSSEDVVRVVTEQLAPGETASFTIVRDGRRMHVPVRLAQRPRS